MAIHEITMIGLIFFLQVRKSTLFTNEVKETEGAVAF